MKFTQGDSAMQDFDDALDPVNATADKSPGFVWRMISDESNSEKLEKFEKQGWLVNMSVWQSLADLRAFIASPLHLSVRRRRSEWFSKYDQETMVLWWVAEGHRPGFIEAMERLEYLREQGPSAHAFSFSNNFDPPETLQS